MDINRLSLCVFFEKNGEVRDYFSYYIKSLAEVCNKVMIIVNGEITDEGKQKLLNIPKVEIVVQEKFGIDFAAWKFGIERIGWKNIVKYDEIVLTNCSCYGPFCPFSDIFTKMDKRNCDFWGITKHPAGMSCKHKFAEHLQSYFLVIKKKMLYSNEFRNYWNNLILYNDYESEFLNHETKFTKYFEDLGFVSASFIEDHITQYMKINPMFYTDFLLKNYKFPLIKRKAIIFENYAEILNFRLFFNPIRVVVDYIKENTNYDIDLIYQDILSLYPMSSIQEFLGLNYVLLDKINFKKSVKQNKIALILYVYYEDLIDYCLKYVKSMPNDSDIYVVSSKQSVLDIIKKKSSDFDEYNFEFRLKNNRGRDVSAYLVACKDVFEKYDLICCMHDKKSTITNSGPIVGMDFQDYCFENNLMSKEYVENIINLFDMNEKIGLLCPPPFKGVFKNKIGENLDVLNALYNMLNLTVPFDITPNAPWGACFWIRGDAIKPLFNKNWSYDDFPDEPLPIDGTISHAIERIYPTIVQEAGYLSGVIMTEKYAIDVLNNSLYVNKWVQESHKILKQVKGIKKLFSIVNIYIVGEKYKQITIFNKKILIR